MKRKNYILASIVLMTLYLVSCKKSESADLHFLELKGNVKSVTYYTTDDVNSKGKKTRQSHRWEMETYCLNEDGQIITIVNGNEDIRIARNKKGQIETISVENPKCDGGYTKSYIWDAKGYPINEECEVESGGEYTCDITYNDSNEIIEKFYWISWGGDSGKERYKKYTILQVDEQGNWIKRLCKTSGYDINGYEIKYSIEERVITYYEETQNNSSESHVDF